MIAWERVLDGAKYGEYRANKRQMPFDLSIRHNAVDGRVNPGAQTGTGPLSGQALPNRRDATAPPQKSSHPGTEVKHSRPIPSSPWALLVVEEGV